MRWVKWAVLGAVLVYGTAFAKPDDLFQTDSKQSAAVKAILDDDTLGAPSNISDADKKSRTENMLSEMRSALKRASEIMAEAVASKDVVQKNCVEEKLRSIKGLLAIAEKSSVHLLDSIADQAKEVANHEFTKIAIAHQKTLILRSEADRCVGESTIYTGETDVEIERDPNLRSGDPTDTPLPPFAPETPPVASKF
ncbi:MAG: hypothetical protein U1E65_17425 [Myxococcota bacterium]